mgnify:CR=1 FL=1
MLKNQNFPAKSSDNPTGKKLSGDIIVFTPPPLPHLGPETEGGINSYIKTIIAHITYLGGWGAKPPENCAILGPQKH